MEQRKSPVQKFFREGETPEGVNIAERTSAAVDKAAESLRIESYHSAEEVSRIKEVAARIAADLDLGEEFFRDCRRGAILLGAAAEWDHTESFGDKRRLAEVVCIASREPRTGKGFRSRITWEVGEGEVKKGFLSSCAAIEKEWRRDKDEAATAEFEKELDAQEGGLLSEVREALGITSETQRPVTAYVLKLSAAKMFEKYGSYAFQFSEYGADGTFVRAVIALPSDYRVGYRAETSRHEYAHSQATGFNFGEHSLLLRGLNESITDYVAGCVGSQYELQKAVLYRLLDGAFQPDDEKLVRAYVTGRQEDLLPVMREVVAVFGLRGYLAVARMRGEVNPRYKKAWGALISPLKAADILDACKRG